VFLPVTRTEGGGPVADWTGGQQWVVLMVDLDGEVLEPLSALDELLIALASWEADDRAGEPTVEAPLELPPPLADQVALGAVQRLTAALGPTQFRRTAGRLSGPGGLVDHAQLTVLTLAAADVRILSSTAQALGHPALDADLADLVHSFAAGLSSPRERVDRAEFVSRIARLAGLLDLAPTPESQLLVDRLTAAEPGTDVVLTPAEERAYEHTADRMNAMWGLGSAAARALY
jgi:hypothetical protein